MTKKLRFFGARSPLTIRMDWRQKFYGPSPKMDFLISILGRQGGRIPEGGRVRPSPPPPPSPNPPLLITNKKVSSSQDFDAQRVARSLKLFVGILLFVTSNFSESIDIDTSIKFTQKFKFLKQKLTKTVLGDKIFRHVFSKFLITEHKFSTAHYFIKFFKSLENHPGQIADQNELSP